MQKTENPVIQEILNKLALLDENKQIEPMKATIHGGSKLFMERIDESSKYLSHLRKVIYDVKFKSCYYHNNRVPNNCFAVEDRILFIEESCSLENENKFLEILNKPQPVSQGMKFYLDGVLYLQNVPFLNSDRRRDDILHHRHDGTMLFDVLKIVDPCGNVTEFHASPAVAKRMERARSEARILKMVNPEVVYD